MDVVAISLIAVGLIAALLLIYVSWRLDRRSQRASSARWMRAWTIRTRVLADLWRNLHGPLRLEDRSHDPPAKKQRRQSLKRKQGAPKR
jgi:hypothetical protein